MAVLGAMERKLTWLPASVFAVSLVLLVLGAAGGPGWDAAAGHAVLAAHLERTASTPLYGVVAGAFALLPVGEIGFRLALLAALLGALTATGVVVAARALLPKDPVAGVVGAVLLVLTPSFRDAAGFANPSMLAACGIVWAIAAAANHARDATPRRAALALAMVALVVGSAPWLGAMLALLIIGWLVRTGASRDLLVIGVGAIGAIIVALWLGAVGSVPGPAPSLSAMVAASGRGAGAIVIGAGLLGAAFAAVTGLALARWFAAAIVLALIHAIVIEQAPMPLLAVLAIGAAVIPSAVVRVLDGARRELVTVIASAPLIGAALATGPAFGVDDPGRAPAQLAADVIGELPPGPGVIVATRASVWSSINYAQAVAGARPDLTLAPPLAQNAADGLVADTLRAKRIAGADVPAFGRLDPTLAIPRGRGFELRGVPADRAVPPSPPATYASATGAELAVLLAIARARYEAGLGRLDAAARAAGLTTRFRAADLALLATALPTPARPALYTEIPRLDDARPGPWLLDLFGDDLAWVAGLPQPTVDGPPARKLHALWRELLSGKITADDPAFAALGPAAVEATKRLTDARSAPP